MHRSTPTQSSGDELVACKSHFWQIARGLPRCIDTTLQLDAVRGLPCSPVAATLPAMAAAVLLLLLLLWVPLSETILRDHFRIRPPRQVIRVRDPHLAVVAQHAVSVWVAALCDFPAPAADKLPLPYLSRPLLGVARYER
eukprot:CAMPEP_0181205182 /NCGR_PEP_ID=MMETSP1096-20121128/20330_1 /TAXON_ID=156174 ORGANISM="Chrysochromulina ericina, Strain CCMP281" /NCGR_SAMPLE_ID=MMETSP1096 /ASSEMBLY_ACC=CAM_ASM_000453 /LENGTH=139 /DNA_ID=CAMNT_0023295927 /DNA_START=355 /DNA_END=771 /DNA_ORIENTATION=-